MNPIYRDAIASIESKGSGDYAALGPKIPKTGDRAYGRYQVMGANIPQWTKAALGKSMTPQEFLKNPAAQDAVFDHRFGGYVAKYGPEKAARAWFGGEGAINKPKAKDPLGTDVASYGTKFMAALGGATPAAAVPPASAGGDLVPLVTPSNPVAGMADIFKTAQQAPGVPSYAAEIAAIQNAPNMEDQAFERSMIEGAVADDATRARSEALAAFFGEPPTPDIQIPAVIDESINRYLARLS